MSRAPDPVRGSWLHSQLKQEVIAAGRRQRASWAAWDRKLAESEQRIRDLLAREAAAEREAWERVEAVAAEPVDAPAAEPVPEPASDPDTELLAASPWSPRYRAWREEHVSQGRGLI